MTIQVEKPKKPKKPEIKIKVAYCECGEYPIMASSQVQAELDMEIITAFVGHAQKGRKIDYLTHAELKKAWSRSPHTCNKIRILPGQTSITF